MRHQEKKYSITTTTTQNHQVQNISFISVRSFSLQTTAKSPSVGKEYMCFQINGKSDQYAKCVKSRIMTTVTECVLSIDTFEQLCVVIKVMLQ